MKRLCNLLLNVAVSAFIVTGIAVNPALAQDKAKDTKAAPATKAEKGKPTVKVLIDNDKVRVVEATYRPGDESDSAVPPYRIVRLLQGGTLQRTYADGKVEKFERKTGEVSEVRPDAPFKIKNIGKTTVVFFSVNIKEAKK